LSADCQQLYADIPSNINLDNKLNLHLPEVNKYENMAKIGLDCMQRANSTLEDFVSNSLCYTLRYSSWHLEILV